MAFGLALPCRPVFSVFVESYLHCHTEGVQGLQDLGFQGKKMIELIILELERAQGYLG